MRKKTITDQELKQLKIAVIFGGRSKEKPGSLVSGKTVYKSLKKQGFNVFPVDPAEEDEIEELKKADVVFLILHGRYGEDGKMQGYLETLGIPYTGSGVLASAIGMDKLYFKRLLISSRIPTPKYEVLDSTTLSQERATGIASKLGLPMFLKPVSEGGSLGASVIHNRKGLLRNLKEAEKDGYDKFFVEEYIKGRALTVGLLERGNKLIVLPILETISKKEFYDYEAKHDDKLHFYKCPAPLPRVVSREIQNIAEKVYKLLGCHGFCRVDFMLSAKDKPYVLEVNTLPGMSPHSNMATMAEAVGINYEELVVEMLKTAFKKPIYTS